MLVSTWLRYVWTENGVSRVPPDGWQVVRWTGNKASCSGTSQFSMGQYESIGRMGRWLYVITRSGMQRKSDEIPRKGTNFTNIRCRKNVESRWILFCNRTTSTGIENFTVVRPPAIKVLYVSTGTRSHFYFSSVGGYKNARDGNISNPNHSEIFSPVRYNQPIPLSDSLHIWYKHTVDGMRAGVKTSLYNRLESACGLPGISPPPRQYIAHPTYRRIACSIYIGRAIRWHRKQANIHCDINMPSLATCNVYRQNNIYITTCATSI